MSGVSRRPLPETCGGPTVWLWCGHAIYLGPSLRLAPHSTSVYCLVVGLDAPFVLRVPGCPDVTPRTVLVPPRVERQIVAMGQRMMFCYFDSTSRRSGRYRDRMSGAIGEFSVDHRDADLLIALCEGPRPEPSRLLAAASGAVEGRIDGVARTLRAHPSAAVSADEFARLAGLSRPYFLRLFAAETGTSFRRYRLWARMLQVAAAISKGTGLTRAAVDAGFATPSHFSDAFRRMFGLSASTLLAAGTEIVIEDGG
ncbi:helix-turn-helix domain-containing protein [Rhodococcus sp. NPDC127528]|uniref:AraC family transcriptional regulator n=1 Tax=unclassified Rhodococcus (in: high G+C Gram-positive bacteria) TaxID=192944 RepID=UPI00362FA918